MKKKEYQVKYVKNGKVAENYYYNLVSESEFFSFEDNCFLDFFNPGRCSKVTLKIKKNIVESVNILLNNLSKISPNIISNFYQEMKLAKSYIDFDILFKKLFEEYSNLINNDDNLKSPQSLRIINAVANLQNQVNIHSEITYSIFMKSLIQKYFLMKLYSLDEQELAEIYMWKLNEKSFDTVMAELDEQFDEISRKNGLYDFSLKCLYDQIDVAIMHKKKHLCWKCANAMGQNCPKIISGFPKPPISYFDFISEGYEMSGEISSYVVSKCDLYICDKSLNSESNNQTNGTRIRKR